MSLSQERPTNPTNFRFEAKLGEGKVIYYDRNSKENVDVPMPFEFIVLDQLATIKGWSDTDESGFWSNEVRSVGNDPVTVRTAKGVKDTGLWKDIKSNNSIAGARYHASIYIAHQSENGMVISNLSLKGAALGAWIEFTGKNKVTNTKVSLAEWKDDKKGAVKFKVPVFSGVPMTDTEKAEAVELDKELQEYFNQYFSAKPATNDNVAVEAEEASEQIDLSSIPF